MFDAGAIIFVRKLMDTPISSSIPLPQVVLGCIGLCSMISYALTRQRILKRQRPDMQADLTDYLFPYIREWFGGHHGATGHAGAAGK